MLQKINSTDYNTQWATPSGGGSLPNETASLGSDVQLPVSGTYYDGPEVSLTAGTWLVTGHFTFQRTATTATQWIGRISDGTNHHASGQAYVQSVSGGTTQMGMSAIITLGSTTTIKLQATTNAGNTACLMKAETPASGSGNNATRINAVRLA